MSKLTKFLTNSERSTKDRRIRAMGNLLAPPKHYNASSTSGQNGSSIARDGDDDVIAQQGEKVYGKIMVILIFLLT